MSEIISLEVVLKIFFESVELDSKRDIHPLRKAKDAIEIDTSELTTEQIFSFLIEKIYSK